MRQTITLKNFEIIKVFEPGADDFDFIEKKFKIEKSDLEEIKNPYHLTDYDLRKFYSYFIFAFPQEENFLKESLEIENVYLFFSKNFIIIFLDQKSKINEIIDSLIDDLKMTNTEKFVHYFVKKSIKIYYDLLKTINFEIDFLEKNITSANIDVLNKRSVFLLKNIIFLITNIRSWQDIFAEIITQKYPNFRRYELWWQSLLDEINYINTKLEDFQLIVEAYQKSIENIISNKINRNILLITILQTIFLPPTLIASIYGMNVNLPFQTKNFAFWLLILIMLGITLTFWFMIKKIQR